MSMKPILFNTDMVKAILEGRKSCTRRIIKSSQIMGVHPNGVRECTPGEFLKDKSDMFEPYCDMTDSELVLETYKKPYRPGDILYVRETWERFECWNCEGDERENCPKEPKKSVLDKTCGCYMYRATDEISGDAKWHPSIHMPKRAARIWLKVTDVRVEQLQDITEEGASTEGSIDNRGFIHSYDNEYTHIHTAREDFAEIWNSTIKKSDLDFYGWDANPYVWVIEFERCDKPESEG